MSQMMSEPAPDSKEAGLEVKGLKRYCSGPSSPRTPSPAASLITTSSATDKSKACDEASCSGAPLSTCIMSCFKSERGDHVAAFLRLLHCNLICSGGVHGPLSQSPPRVRVCF